MLSKIPSLRQAAIEASRSRTDAVPYYCRSGREWSSTAIFKDAVSNDDLRTLTGYALQPIDILIYDGQIEEVQCLYLFVFMLDIFSKMFWCTLSLPIPLHCDLDKPVL